MSKTVILGKFIKTAGIVLIIAAVGLTFYFGVMKSTNVADAPIALPTQLNMYPSEITGDATWAPIFSLESFLNGEEFNWDTVDPIAIYGGFDDATNQHIYNETEYATIDAINLLRLASYNEQSAPYYAYYTDAGGSADIAGAVKGNLMSQTIHIQNGTEFFHQNINAIVEDPNFKMNEVLKSAAVAILNKARRHLLYKNTEYRLNGDSPVYLFGEDYLDAAGKATVFDDGRCTASWLAAVEKYDYTAPDEAKDPDEAGISADERSSRFKAKYGNKFILSLNDSDYTGDFAAYKPQNWFDHSKTKIERIYVDANGNDTTDTSGNYYIKCTMSADLPERGEMSLEQWEAACNNMPINKSMAKDGNGKTALMRYTDASPVCFTGLTYTFEVWDCGLLKSWRTDEGWLGTMAGLVSGDVKPFNPTAYSYAAVDCDVKNFTEFLKVTA